MTTTESDSTVKTAAGDVVVIESAFSPMRQNTRMFFGTLADGHFVVSSRFQIEIKTKHRDRAEYMYRKLISA